MLKQLSISLALTLAAAPVTASSLWEKTKSATGAAVGVVGETVESVGKTVSGEKESPDELRRKIDASEADAMQRLGRQSATAKALIGSSVAHAVFDTRKISLLLTTGFGAGVMVDDAGKRTYMKMATGGVNVGYGIQSYRVIFLFPDKTSARDFVESGWDASADAMAAANEDSADTGLKLKNGVTVFKLDEKGLALSATLTGTKYWKDADLN
jgi:lipid-binding SYLF domain-containing protein